MAVFSIGKDEWPSLDPEYPDSMIIRKLTNKEYIELLGCNIDAVESFLVNLISKNNLIENFDYKKIRGIDKLFLFNKIKESSSLSNVITFKEVQCTKGHILKDVKIDIVKDVDIRFRPDDVPLSWDFETEGCGILRIEAYKLTTVPDFRKRLIATLPQEMHDVIDDNVVKLAALVNDTDALTVYNIFDKTPLANDYTPSLTQDEIETLYGYIHVLTQIGMDVIEKPCDHDDCQGSFFIDPYDIYFKFIQVKRPDFGKKKVS